MYDIILRAWLYLTPIIYPETILPAAYRFWILRLNPMYYMIKLIRDPVYNGTVPSINILLASIAIAAFTLIAGWVYFSNQTDSFAYKA